MANKKTNNNILYLVIGALLVLVFMKYGAMTTTNTVTNTTIINLLENPQQEDPTQCSLEVIEEVICVGDSATGVVEDGITKMCYVFANDGTGWKLLFSDYTGMTGILRRTETINILGTFTFRALCDMNDNGFADTEDCLTNPDTLTVTNAIPPCPEGQQGGDDGNPYDPQNYPCEWVVNPTSQASCDGHPGCYNADEPYCMFVAATNTQPAKCVCAPEPDNEYGCDDYCRDMPDYGWANGFCLDNMYEPFCPGMYWAQLYPPYDADMYCPNFPGTALKQHCCCT